MKMSDDLSSEVRPQSRSHHHHEGRLCLCVDLERVEDTVYADGENEERNHFGDDQCGL
jgi:hypothetical protein